MTTFDLPELGEGLHRLAHGIGKRLLKNYAETVLGTAPRGRHHTGHG